MKSREYEIIDKLNEVIPSEVVPAEDMHSHYDAECKTRIFEIKYRNDYYEDKMCEAMKLFTNLHIAESKGKKFVYVVQDSKGIWVLNITDWLEEILELPFDVMTCPATTDFGRNDKFKKVVVNIPESLFTKL